MATITVQSLIDRAVAAADMHDNFVTTAQWLYWANQYHKELSVMIAQMGVPYFQSDEPVLCTGATQYVITEPLAILAVYRVRSDGSYYKLKPMDSIQKITSEPRSGEPTQFYLNRDGNGIYISMYPNPDSGNVVVRTISYPDNLVLATPGPTDSTTVNYPLGWEQWVVLRMASSALAKEETVNPVIQSEISKLESHIEISARNFMMTDVQKIRNVAEDNWDNDSQWIWV